MGLTIDINTHPYLFSDVCDTQEKVRRFGEEIEFIRTRWITLLKKGDPYYNPNFSLKKCNYALKP